MVTSKPSDTAVPRRRHYMIGFLVFGVLSGFTAAGLVLVLEGSVLAAILAYSVVGSIGLLGLALTAIWA